jgi:hypothetical protein
VARRDVARPGRLRWLQHVAAGDAVWDAFEAPEGDPLPDLVAVQGCLPWSVLRHWLHDLASELWDATGDGTLPAELSVDHVWITSSGRAILLDRAWPEAAIPARPILTDQLSGQQRFLAEVAAFVEPTSLPLHARYVLDNLMRGSFEKLSFLAGTLRGLLSRPAEVGRGIRAGSIFLLPLYVWVVVFVGLSHGRDLDGGLPGWTERVVVSAVVVLAAVALLQLPALALRTTASHAVFRLAVVDARGQPATRLRLLLRWAVIWLPLFVPLGVVALLLAPGDEAALISAAILIALWLVAAAWALVEPSRGLADRLAGTAVVRR